MARWQDKLFYDNVYDNLTEEERKRFDELWDAGVIDERNAPEIARNFMRSPTREGAFDQAFKTGFRANAWRELGEIKEGFLDPGIGVRAAEDFFLEEQEKHGKVGGLFTGTGKIAWSAATTPVRSAWTIGTGQLGEVENPLETLVGLSTIIPVGTAAAGLTSATLRQLAKGATVAGKTAKATRLMSTADKWGRVPRHPGWKWSGRATEAGDLITGITEWPLELLGDQALGLARNLGSLGINRFRSQEGLVDTILGIADRIQTDAAPEDKIVQATTLINEPTLQKIVEENEDVEDMEEARALLAFISVAKHKQKEIEGEGNRDAEADAEARAHDEATGSSAAPRPWDTISTRSRQQMREQSESRAAEMYQQAQAQAEQQAEAEQAQAEQRESDRQFARAHPKDWNIFRNRYKPLYDMLADTSDQARDWMLADFASGTDPVGSLLDEMVREESEGVDIIEESPAIATQRGRDRFKVLIDNLFDDLVRQEAVKSDDKTGDPVSPEVATQRAQAKLQDILGDDLYNQFYREERTTDEIVADAHAATDSMMEEDDEPTGETDSDTPGQSQAAEETEEGEQADAVAGEETAEETAAPEDEEGRAEADAQRDTAPEVVGEEDVVRYQKEDSTWAEVPVVYKLIERSSAIASHKLADNKVSFIINKIYNWALGIQQRKKARFEEVQERAQDDKFNPFLLAEKTEGATRGTPTLLESYDAVGGNHRLMLLEMIYDRDGDTKESYIAMLEERLPDFGIDPAELQNFEEPILVRQAVGAVDNPAEFARATNTSDAAPRTAEDQALQDANALTDEILEMFDFGEVGGSNRRTIADMLANPSEANQRALVAFIDNLPQGERARYRRGDARNLSPEARVLFENAILAKIFTSERGRLLLTTKEGGTLVPEQNRKALMASLAHLAKFDAFLKAYHEDVQALSISDDVAAALHYLSHLRGHPNNLKIGQAAAHLDSTQIENDETLTPDSIVLMRAINGITSAGPIANILVGYITTAIENIRASGVAVREQETLFEGAVKYEGPSKTEMLEQVIAEVKAPKRQSDESGQTTLIGDQDAESEGRHDAREGDGDTEIRVDSGQEPGRSGGTGRGTDGEDGSRDRQPGEPDPDATGLGGDKRPDTDEGDGDVEPGAGGGVSQDGGDIPGRRGGSTTGRGREGEGTDQGGDQDESEQPGGGSAPMSDAAARIERFRRRRQGDTTPTEPQTEPETPTETPAEPQEEQPEEQPSEPASDAAARIERFRQRRQQQNKGLATPLALTDEQVEILNDWAAFVDEDTIAELEKTENLDDFQQELLASLKTDPDNLTAEQTVLRDDWAAFVNEDTIAELEQRENLSDFEQELLEALQAQQGIEPEGEQKTRITANRLLNDTVLKPPSFVSVIFENGWHITNNNKSDNELGARLIQAGRDNPPIPREEMEALGLTHVQLGVVDALGDTRRDGYDFPTDSAAIEQILLALQERYPLRDYTVVSEAESAQGRTPEPDTDSSNDENIEPVEPETQDVPDSVPIAEDHVSDLHEPTALAAQNHPDVSDITLNISEATREVLSEAQALAVKLIKRATGMTMEGTLEGVIYQLGFMIGDGTGSGKTITGLTFLLDQINDGHKQHLIVGPKQDLYTNNYRADMKKIGGNTRSMFNFGDLKESGRKAKSNGIGFTTYKLMSSRPSLTTGKINKRMSQLLLWLTGKRAPLEILNPGAVSTIQQIKSASQDRQSMPTYHELFAMYDVMEGENKTAFEESIPEDLKDILRQPSKRTEAGYKKIIKILKDFDNYNTTYNTASIDEFTQAASKFDGVILFDESHSMRGKDANQRDVGLILQNILPAAKVVYMSATPITRVSELQYAPRLGLWGPGTSFEDYEAFYREFGGEDITVKEIIAKDLKGYGRYLRRSLDMSGVKWQTREHAFTDDQIDTYNAYVAVMRDIKDLIRLWVDRQMMDEKDQGKLLGRIMRQFYNSQQILFEQIQTAYKTEALLPEMVEKLKAGNKVAVQVSKTYDAAQQRAEKRAQETGEPVDFSLKNILIDFLMSNSSPVYQYTVGATNKIDLDKDADGNPIVNSASSVRDRDLMIKTIQQMPDLPNAPLDMLHQAMRDAGFQTAEITGRSHYYVDGKKVKNPTNTDAIEKQFRETRDLNFIIISDAGGEGRNLQTMRPDSPIIDYDIDSSWNVINTIQKFGRFKRTGAAHDPIYVLTSTDSPAAKRKAGALAEKLTAMGALATGQARSQMNLRDAQTRAESETDAEDSNKDEANSYILGRYGKAAMASLWRFVHASVEGGDAYFTQMMQELGYVDKNGSPKFEVDSNGNLSGVPEPKQFLARLYGVPYKRQSEYAELFFAQLDGQLLAATEQGTLDAGTTQLRTAGAEIARKQTLHTHAESGTTTDVVEVTGQQQLQRNSWEVVEGIRTKKTGFETLAGPFARYIRNKKTGKVYALFITTEVAGTEEARGITRYKRFGVYGKADYTTSEQLTSNNWETLLDRETPQEERAEKLAEVQKLWKEAEQTAKKSKPLSRVMITGMLTPVWDRISLRMRDLNVRSVEEFQDLLRAAGFRSAEELERSMQIRQVVLADGTPVQGRIIPAAFLEILFNRFGIQIADTEFADMASDAGEETQDIDELGEMLSEQKAYVVLDNGAVLHYVDEDTIEVFGFFTEEEVNSIGLQAVGTPEASSRFVFSDDQASTRYDTRGASLGRWQLPADKLGDLIGVMPVATITERAQPTKPLNVTGYTRPQESAPHPDAANKIRHYTNFVHLRQLIMPHLANISDNTKWTTGKLAQRNDREKSKHFYLPDIDRYITLRHGFYYRRENEYYQQVTVGIEGEQHILENGVALQIEVGNSITPEIMQRSYLQDVIDGNAGALRDLQRGGIVGRVAIKNNRILRVQRELQKDENKNFRPTRDTKPVPDAITNDLHRTSMREGELPDGQKIVVAGLQYKWASKTPQWAIGVRIGSKPEGVDTNEHAPGYIVFTVSAGTVESAMDNVVKKFQDNKLDSGLRDRFSDLSNIDGAFNAYDNYMRELAEEQQREFDAQQQQEETRAPSVGRSSGSSQSSQEIYALDHEAIASLETNVEKIVANIGDTEVKRRILGIYGKILAAEQVNLVGREVSSAYEIAVLGQAARNPLLEINWTFYIKDGKIIAHDAYSLNSAQRTRADMKALQQRLKDLKADGFYDLHNHPTAPAAMSGPDLTVSHQQKAYFGDQYLGAVVINSGTYARLTYNANGTYDHQDYVELKPEDVGWDTTQPFDENFIKADDPLYKNLTPQAIQKFASMYPSVNAYDVFVNPRDPALRQEARDLMTDNDAPQAIAELGNYLKTRDDMTVIVGMSITGKITMMSEFSGIPQLADAGKLKQFLYESLDTVGTHMFHIVATGGQPIRQALHRALGSRSNSTGLVDGVASVWVDGDSVGNIVPIPTVTTIPGQDIKEGREISYKTRPEGEETDEQQQEEQDEDTPASEPADAGDADDTGAGDTEEQGDQPEGDSPTRDDTIQAILRGIEDGDFSDDGSTLEVITDTDEAITATILDENDIDTAVLHIYREGSDPIQLPVPSDTAEAWINGDIAIEDAVTETIQDSGVGDNEITRTIGGQEVKFVRVSAALPTGDKSAPKVKDTSLERKPVVIVGPHTGTHEMIRDKNREDTGGVYNRRRDAEHMVSQRTILANPDEAERFSKWQDEKEDRIVEIIGKLRDGIEGTLKSEIYKVIRAAQRDRYNKRNYPAIYRGEKNYAVRDETQDMQYEILAMVQGYNRVTRQRTEFDENKIKAFRTRLLMLTGDYPMFTRNHLTDMFDNIMSEYYDVLGKDYDADKLEMGKFYAKEEQVYERIKEEGVLRATHPSGKPTENEGNLLYLSYGPYYRRGNHSYGFILDLEKLLNKVDGISATLHTRGAWTQADHIKGKDAIKKAIEENQGADPDTVIEIRIPRDMALDKQYLIGVIEDNKVYVREEYHSEAVEETEQDTDTEPLPTATKSLPEPKFDPSLDIDPADASQVVHVMSNPDDFDAETKDNLRFQRILNTFTDPAGGLRQVLGIKTRQAARLMRKTLSSGFGILEEMSKTDKDGDDKIGDHIRKNILKRQFIGKSGFGRDAARIVPVFKKLEAYVRSKAQPSVGSKVSPQDMAKRGPIRQKVNDAVWRFIEDNKAINDPKLLAIAEELKEVWREVLIEGTQTMVDLTRELDGLLGEKIYITDSSGKRVPWYPESFDGFVWDAQTRDFKRNEGTRKNPSWVHYSIEDAHRKANKLYTPHHFKHNRVRNQFKTVQEMVNTMNEILKDPQKYARDKDTLKKVGITHGPQDFEGYLFDPDGTLLYDLDEMLAYAMEYWTSKEASLRGLLEYTDAGIRAERYGQGSPGGPLDPEGKIGYYGHLERARETDDKHYVRDVRILLENRRLMWDRMGEFATIGQMSPILGSSPRLELVLEQVRAFRKNDREKALAAVAIALKAGDPTSMFERLPQFGISVEHGLNVQQDWRERETDPDKPTRTRRTDRYQELDIARMDLTDEVMNTLRTIGFITKNEQGVDVVSGKTVEDRQLTVARFFHEFYNTIAQREASVKDMYLSLGHWHNQDPLDFDDAKFWQKISDITTMSTLSWTTAIQNILEVPILAEQTGTLTMLRGLTKMFSKEERQQLLDLAIGLSHAPRFMAETKLAEKFLGSNWSGFSKTDRISRAAGLGVGLVNAKNVIREYVETTNDRTKARLRRYFDEVQIDTRVIDEVDAGTVDQLLDEAESIIMSGEATPKFGDTATVDKLAWTILQSMHYISDTTFKSYDATSMPPFLLKSSPLVRLFLKYKSWMAQHNAMKYKNFKRAARELKKGNIRPAWNFIQSAAWSGATYGMLISMYAMLSGDEPPEDRVWKGMLDAQTFGASSVLLHMANRADGNWWVLSRDMMGQAAGPVGSIASQLAAPTVTGDFDVVGSQALRRIPVVNVFNRFGGFRLLEDGGQPEGIPTRRSQASLPRVE